MNQPATRYQAHEHAAMQLAIAASAQALARGDMPFGATLMAPAGEVLLVATNNQNSEADCTGHAEMVLVRQAQQQLGLAALRGATVYASGEPCAMCCGAMFWAGIGRVVYAASSAQIGNALGGPSLPIRSTAVVAGAAPALTVEGPLLGEQADLILRQFNASQ